MVSVAQVAPNFKGSSFPGMENAAQSWADFLAVWERPATPRSYHSPTFTVEEGGAA